MLAGVGFGVYDTDMVGQTIQESLNILNDLDYEGDTNSTSREYRFVIYDRVSRLNREELHQIPIQNVSRSSKYSHVFPFPSDFYQNYLHQKGGNGICCTYGNGKYEIYSKGSIVAEGNSFGSIEERRFSIDPRVYFGDEADDSQTTTTSAGSNNPPPTESASGNNTSPAPSSVNNNANVISSNTINNSSTTNSNSKPSKSPQKQMANDQTWWFCGISWDWVTSHCDEAKREFSYIST